MIKNILTLASGGVIAQIISVVTSPILYRIYEKSEYGILGVYMGIVSIVSIFSNMQFSNAILIEKGERESEALFFACRIINLFVSLITFLVIFIFSENISNILNAKGIENWLFMLPLSVFFGGQLDLYRVWANKLGKYTVINNSVLVQSLLTPLFSITTGFLHEGALGLLLGYIAGQVIPMIFIQNKLNKTLTYKYRSFINNVTYIFFLLKKYISYPKYNLPSDFVYRFSSQLPVFMLSNYASIEIVAMYNLSIRMLSLPVQLIGGAIGQVFKEEAIKEYHVKNNFIKSFTKTISLLTPLAVISIIATQLFAPSIFGFIFGLKWIEAGTIAKAMIFMFMFKLVASPLSFSFTIKDKLRESMLWHLLILVLNFLTFYLGFYFQLHYMNILWIFSLSYTILYMIYIYRSYKFSI